LRTEATNNKVRFTGEIFGKLAQEKIPAQID
jgi:hypothetical protein